MSKKQGALLIGPKNSEESGFIARLGVKSHKLSEEDVLDLGLSQMMRKADRSKKVSEEAVMKLLRR